MKKFEDIYFNIKNKIFKNTNTDIARGSVMDTMVYSISSEIADAHKTIEDNKTPYIFTNQKGEDLDSTGYFLRCPRQPNESDSNYLYRLQNWVQRNASCNTIAVEEAIRLLKYSSTGNFVKHTKGIGTGTVYLIPKAYDGTTEVNAIKEAEDKLSKVFSPTSHIDYVIPDIINIKLVAYLDIKDNSDIESIKQSIIKNIKDYINSIAPGERLMLGTINKIGLQESNVEYFNIVQLYENEEENTTFEILQAINKKFMFDQIIWWEVEE